MADMMNFKNIVKDLRLETGVKQKDVAKACDVSPQCISQLEAGTRNPTGTTLVALADYFNCSVDYLLGRSDEYTNAVPNRFSVADPNDEELLAAFHSLPKELQAYSLSYIKKLAALHNEKQ